MKFSLTVSPPTLVDVQWNLLPRLVTGQWISVSRAQTIR